MNYRRVKALIRKEFFQIIRDPSSILIGVVMPLILLFLYGFGLSLDMKNLRIGLVLEDTAPAAQSFAASVQGSTYLDVTIDRTRANPRAGDGRWQDHGVCGRSELLLAGSLQPKPDCADPSDCR